mmetsp:Transcript_49959/g.119206  ORF Transcript_49959/g.119206 Transcript_49959/m.119206 type:complete len:267 (-) Transcript_49959:860-1660(-)
MTFDSSSEISLHALRRHLVPKQGQVLWLPRDQSSIGHVPLVAAARPSQQTQRHFDHGPSGRLSWHCLHEAAGAAWVAALRGHRHCKALLVHHHFAGHLRLGDCQREDTQDIRDLCAEACSSKPRGALCHGDAAARDLSQKEPDCFLVIVLQANFADHLSGIFFPDVRVKVSSTQRFKPGLAKVLHVRTFQLSLGSGKNGLEGSPGFGSCVMPRDQHRDHTCISIWHSATNLVGVRWWQPAAARHAHHLRPHLLYSYHCEVTSYVRD